MPKLLCRVGRQPKKYRYSGFRFDRRGYLSIFSFDVSGKKHRQEYLERGHASVIMPVDLAKREVYFVRQPRHVKAFTDNPRGRRLVGARRDAPAASFVLPAEKVLTWELPAGIIDPGETPAQTAVRELEEETGFVIKPAALTYLGRFYVTLGCCTERAFAFLARIDGRTRRTVACGDGGETIAVWKYSWDEAFRLADEGQIESASTLVMLGHLRKLRDRLDKKK